MSSLRKTVTWMLLLAVLGTAVAGTYVWRIANDRHRIIRGSLEQALAEKVPDWQVSFADLELDLKGTLTLQEVALRLRDHEGALVEVPELVVQLDRELLTSSGVFRIERVTLLEPAVFISREETGRWNWQDLTPPPESDAACPAIDIVNGTIVVHSARTNQLPETSFSCRSVDGRLVPSGHRRYAVRIVTDVDHAGALAINGSFDLKQKAWHLVGDIAALNTQQGALDVAAGLSPELREQVTALSEQNTRGDWAAAPPAGAVQPRPITSTGGRLPLRTATTTVPHSEFSLPELGVQAQLDVHFELQRAGASSPVEYSVAATIHEGQIVNPALPVPLYNLRGRVRASQQQVIIDDVSAEAANGESQLRISGALERTASGWSKDLTIKAVNIVLDPSVREYVHNDSWRKTYDQVQPAGRFNLDVRVAHDGGTKWDVTLNEFTAIECSLLHEQFQYPIKGITGSVWQKGRDFLLKLDGFAGERPVHLEGQVHNPGPELEATLHITAADIPLDRRVLDALALPKYQKVRTALEQLRLEGRANVDATLRRPAGAGQKFALELHVDVHDGALEYLQFPYRITQLSGTIDYDPSVAPVWYFRNLQGVHVGGNATRGPVVLTSRESLFDLRQPPGELVLAITAQNAPVETTDLRRACITASPTLNRIWEELTPAGLLDLDVDLRWRPGPGSKVEVRLPKVTLRDGRIKLRGLPIEWTNVAGTFRWQQGTATIESLRGVHGDTTLEIVTGPDFGIGVVRIEPQPNLDWHAHFDEVRVRGLVCDNELRGALPRGLAEVVKSLDPQGAFDTDLSIDLKGAAPPNQTVTAEWSQRVLLPGNRITAGVVLEQAVGYVQIVRGTWDGTAAVVDGYVDLASARALHMPLQLVRGPFTVDGNVVIIGTPDARNPEWRLAAPVMHDPLNAFGGTDMRVDRFFADERHAGRLGLNAVAVVDPENAENTKYRVAVAVSDASLRAWARERKIAVNKLRGSINGRLVFEGRGTSGRAMVGNGFMKLSNAELFDLPVFAAMMPTLNFKPTSQTLFNEGFADFQLRDGQVIYNAIDLNGDAFRLMGKGWMEYTSDSRGLLNLDFYSKADDQFLGVVGRLPLVSPLFDNWMHIQVTGTTTRPEVHRLPGSPAETLRGLMLDVEKLQSQMMNPFGMQFPNPAPQTSRPRPAGR